MRRTVSSSFTRFQFTLPHGERPGDFVMLSFEGRVSIHAPAWGATGRAEPTVAQGFVSIHAPAWGATPTTSARIAALEVSIHAPAWGATSLSPDAWPIPGVSIHAPAWGATRRVHRARQLLDVSIHAPAWGATPRVSRRSARRAFQFTLPHGERHHRRHRRLRLRRFNSRSRMGSDTAATLRQRANLLVSIHAPAWGATRGGPQEHLALGVSIHAPAWGATDDVVFTGGNKRVSIHAPAWGATKASAICWVLVSFQFTLPHGERRICATVGARILCFNSRSRMGSDAHLPQDGAQWKVSIHAPAWGATRLAASRESCLLFQFTLPHGERPTLYKPMGATLPFQFTLPHGERHGGGLRQRPAQGFNSRSRMGSDVYLVPPRASRS